MKDGAEIWTFVSRDSRGGLEYERIFGTDATAARKHYADAEFRARRDGGHVQLVLNGRVIATYRGVSDTD